MTAEPRHEKQVPPSAFMQLPTPQIKDEDAQQLRSFHATHFVGQAIPEVRAKQPRLSRTDKHDLATVSEDEYLGYYSDGVRRNLTDDQIRMFRHSEIQRLLLKRQRERENEKEEAERRARRQEREAAQRRHVCDVPQEDNVNVLVYDDEPSNPTAAVEREFMWPKLGI